ncbi:hypothetical protein BsWGS_15065 [Bradybaena similaris]
MSTEKERIPYFATAGRGTEGFAAAEIMDKIIPDEVSTRDGKVFFKLSSTIGLSIQKILALRSVERVFMGITDYNNTAYITNKKTFLDKLMCTATSQENFSKAKIVLAEILSHNHEKKAVAVNVSKCMRNSLVPTQARHVSHSLGPGHSCPLRKTCTGMKTAGASSPRQELDSLSFVENSPAEKYRKLDVNVLAAEVSLPQTECNGRILFDKSPDGIRQTNPGCERENLLNYMPQSDTGIDHKYDGRILFNKSPDGIRQTNPGCERENVLNYMPQSDTDIDHKYDGRILFNKSPDGIRKSNPGCEHEIVLNYMPQSDTNIDKKCATQATVSYSQVNQIGSKCDHNVLLDCARQLDSNVERCYDSVKETVNNNETGHISLLKHNTDNKDNQQQTHQYHSLTEDNRDKASLSFRMSIKCSGKVSRWLNIKKLSRDLGWRVARTTGWRVDLRKPQYEVCVHISDDYVTVGVPLTRFPLSRRIYMVDSGLRAPIAWIMSQLCSIKSGDIVLDPMCGKATILMEASSDVKDVWLIGSDRDSSQIDKALQNVRSCSHSGILSLLEADGLNMPYRDSCLDVVVCDAPFNHKHLLTLAPERFYYRFIREINRVLRPQGRCVLLVSEQLQQVVLSFIQGTGGSQQPAPCSTSEASSAGGSKDPDARGEHDNTANSVVMLTFVSSHYVKLGETHACILVMHKES